MTRIATARMAMTIAPVLEPARAKPLFQGPCQWDCALRNAREALGRTGRGKSGSLQHSIDHSEQDDRSSRPDM